MIVFGQNIPLVEALFISLVIIICILVTNVVYMILMMSDLKKLKASLVTERANIYKLEGDISNFEGDKYKTEASQKTAIGTYIHTAFDKGYDRNEIKSVLIKKGWPKQTVEAELGNSVKHLKKFYENSEDKESDQGAIRGYIHKAFDNGLDKNEIRQALVQNGWPKQNVGTELDNAVNHLRKVYSK